MSLWLNYWQVASTYWIANYLSSIIDSREIVWVFFSITWTTSQKTNFLVILISKFRTFNEYKIFEKIWRRNKIIENEYLSKALCNKQIEPFQKKSFNRNVFELWSKQINNNKNQAFSNKIKALQFFCEYYTICAHYNLSTHKF